MTTAFSLFAYSLVPPDLWVGCKVFLDQFVSDLNVYSRHGRGDGESLGKCRIWFYRWDPRTNLHL